jgi:hypothetical protein
MGFLEICRETLHQLGQWIGLGMQTFWPRWTFCFRGAEAHHHPTPEQSYMFERPITFLHGDGSSSTGRVDCYRRGHFVLVVDVGTVIEVYAEFSRSGGTYTPFPDPRSHRLMLADLARPEVLERMLALNTRRAAEEAAGTVSWLRPDFQNPAKNSKK